MAATLTALSGNVQINTNFTSQKGLDLSTPTSVTTMAKRLAYTFGTGALKVNEVWHDRRVLANSTAEDIDLNAVLTNEFGETVTLAKVKAIIVFNRTDETTTSPAHTATTAQITVGGSAGNEFIGPFKASLDAIDVETGGMFCIATPGTGWAVTGASTDILQIENNDGAEEALYDIFIIGDAA